MTGSRRLQELRSMVRGSVRVNEPLREHTTLKIGGPAEVMIFPASEQELVEIVRWCLAEGVPYSVLGFGSNVLAPDEGLAGVVLRTKPALDHIEFHGNRVRVGSGVSVARLVAQAAARGLAGVEALAGVPGSVGGALVMNAGTKMGDISRVVSSVRVVDEQGRIHDLDVGALEYSYRGSRLQREPKWLVLCAELELEPGDAAAIRRKVDEALQYRNRTQPLHLPSAGSIFKNPPGDAAGRLIEQAGCKGLRRGGAQVSEIHANWIVNVGGATAEDVLGLMMEIRRRVMAGFGIDLEPEIRLLGSLRRRWDQAVAAGA